jgi:hypothetical protein
LTSATGILSPKVALKVLAFDVIAHLGKWLANDNKAATVD